MQLGPWLGKPEPLKHGVDASKDLGSLAPRTLKACRSDSDLLVTLCRLAERPLP